MVWSVISICVLFHQRLYVENIVRRVERSKSVNIQNFSLGTEDVYKIYSALYMRLYFYHLYIFITYLYLYQVDNRGT